MRVIHGAERADGQFSFKGVGAFFLAGLTCFAGCATQPVQLNGEVSIPARAGIQKVLVVVDAATQTAPETDQLTVLMQAALREQGFQVVYSENEANLIVLPFFTLLQNQVGFVPAPLQSLFAARDWSATGGNILEGRKALALSSAQDTFTPTSRVGLMVTAIAHATWITLPPDSADAPRVWRVMASAVSPIGEEQKYLPVLVQAAAPFFGKNTNGTITEQIKSPH